MEAPGGRAPSRWCPAGQLLDPLHAIALFSLICLFSNSALGAGYRTANFTVDAPTPQIARQIGDTAEHWRREMALEWLGKELPDWSKACPIKARVSPQLGAGGATSFVFDQGEVFGWRMEIQGSLQRILDSVLPHEVTHTIFASHFRRPLPRWADEGACTTVEHQSEISKQETMLIEFLQTHRGIPFSSMFAMKEYPQDVLPLYAQGHSLAKFLIAQRGKHTFLVFLEDGMQDENWPRAIHETYGYRNLLTLQNTWMDWIQQGRPEILPVSGTTLASAAPGVPTRQGLSPGSRPPVDTVSLQASSQPGTRPAMTEWTAAQGIHVVTEPWTGKGALKDPAKSQTPSAITWPTTGGKLAKASPRGSIYDAARQRGTLYR